MTTDVFKKTKKIFAFVKKHGKVKRGKEKDSFIYHQLKVHDKLISIRFCNENGNDNYLRIQDDNTDLFAFIHNRSPLANQLLYQCCNEYNFGKGIDALYNELYEELIKN